MSDDPKGAIRLEQGGWLPDRSSQVAHVQVAGGAMRIDAGVPRDPRVPGHRTADTIRHAPRADAGTRGIARRAAPRRIVDDVTEELRDQPRDQVSPIDTIQQGSLN